MERVVRVLRYEVPIDDDQHRLELTGPVLSVDQRQNDRLDVWALEGQYELPNVMQVQVFGTGHDVPTGYQYLGSALSPAQAVEVPVALGEIRQHVHHFERGRLVWHLFQVVPCSNHNPVQHRDGKPPWCRACGLTADYQEPRSRLGR